MLLTTTIDLSNQPLFCTLNVLFNRKLKSLFKERFASSALSRSLDCDHAEHGFLCCTNLLKLLTVSSCVVNRTQPSALLATVQLPAGSGIYMYVSDLVTVQ